MGGAGGPSSARRRASRKATLGSTSYDEARDPADTTWAGASWYGPTSGEYWRVNPREYADPRKHGPEYQSRARRHSTTTGEAWAETEAASADGPDVGFEAEPAEGPAEAEESASAGRRSSSRAWSPPPRTWQHAQAGDGSNPAIEDEEGPAQAFATLGRLLDNDPRDPVRRLGYALVAWAPVGLASAAVIGSATGCATYGASCTGAAPLLPWLAQAVILGLLLLVPRLTRILAVGSIAVILASVPLIAVLLAFGGSGEPGAPVVLQTLLTGAWIVGIGAGILGMARLRRVAGP